MKFSKFLSLCFVFFFLLFFLNDTVHALEKTRMIVKFHEDGADRYSYHRAVDPSVVSTIDPLNLVVVEVSKDQEDHVRDLYRNDPRVEYIEPDYVATADLLTTDPAVMNNSQWGLSQTQTYSTGQSAWDITTGDPSVLVAVIDTGIDTGHEDLIGKVKGSHNCTDTNTSEDRYGHGTHVAGIIAANTNNGIGVAGVGFQTGLLNAKALGDDGSGYYSWIADCIVWSADNGARVINMSLSGNSSSQALLDAITYAREKGVVVVAAAGNSDSQSASYPAYYPSVLSVAAVDSSDKKASFSNYGKWVKVAAPGVSIYSTLPHYSNHFKILSYGILSGTSMASPHVAGLAGLLWSLPGMSQAGVEAAIEDNADKITGTGSSWAFGRINAYKSLLAASGGSVVSIPVTPTITQTPTPTKVPSPTPTVTPKPTIIPTKTPTPTPKNIFSRLCLRYPYFCN